jgi:GNAT superfamily N-acetyltransferase
MADEPGGIPVTVRTATEADTALVLGFIRDLARYERLEHRVVATEGDLRRWLFGERPLAEVLIASEGDEPAGFALFFTNFSTFLGQPGIYLEDLYVREGSRGRGIGRRLLQQLARMAKERGWGRVEWSVLDWNQPAVGFYERLGATVLNDWRICRLTGDALTRLAGG